MEFKPAVAATHAVLILACMAALYPVLWVVKMALTPGQAFSMSGNPLPSEVSFENFEYIFTMGDGLFWRQLFNSIVIAAVTTVVGVILACTAAYAFSRFRFPGRCDPSAGTGR